MTDKKQPTALKKLHDALDEHLAKISETKRRHAAEMDELFKQGRGIQMQVLDMLIRQQSEGAAKS